MSGFFRAAVFVSLGLFLIAAGSASADTSWQGKGTEVSPYQISSAEDLKTLAEKVNDGERYSNTYFVLTKDITLSDSWTPIGDNDNYKPFCGHFNGSGHTISNLTVNNVDYAGLFGYVGSGAVIENVLLSNVNVQGTEQAGGLICYAVGSDDSGVVIRNCGIDGRFVSASGYAGGLATQISGNVSIKNCYTAGLTVSSSSSNAGGLVGMIESSSYGSASIQNCYTWNVSSSNTNFGGILGAGASGSCNISSCYTNSNSLVGNSGSEVTPDGSQPTAGQNGWAEISEEGTRPAFLWENREGHFEGFGTSNNPFKITNETELRLLSKLVNNGSKADTTETPYSECKYILSPESGDAITLKQEFTTIGNQSNPFKGEFDGKGKTIKNLKIPSASGSAGLFGYIDGGKVKDLKIDGVNISVNGGENIAGSIAGTISGGASITECVVTQVNITGYGTKVGGAVGKAGADCSLSKISVYGSEVSSMMYIGGVVGYSESDISNSSASVTKILGLGGAVGGIVGYTASNITNAYANAEVSGWSYVGGIVGQFDDIHGNADKEPTIVYTYFTGKVNASGTDSSGIAGAGGIAGFVNLTNAAYVNNSVSLAKEISAENNYGRVIGDMNSNTNPSDNSAWKFITDSSGKLFEDGDGDAKKRNGTGVSVREFWNQTSFFTNLTWDFKNIWVMCTDEKYKLPIFKWQSEVRPDVSYLTKEPGEYTGISYKIFEGTRGYLNLTSAMGGEVLGVDRWSSDNKSRLNITDTLYRAESAGLVNISAEKSGSILALKQYNITTDEEYRSDNVHENTAEKIKPVWSNSQKALLNYTNVPSDYAIVKPADITRGKHSFQIHGDNITVYQGDRTLTKGTEYTVDEWGQIVLENPSGTYTYTYEGYPLGDVNKDSKVDITDASLIALKASGSVGFSDFEDEEYVYGNVTLEDGDESLSAKDAHAVLELIVGKKNELKAYEQEVYP